MKRHLLVTNDFPPKIGGIQSYLWELWRRLPPEDVVVLTSPHAAAAAFDRAQAFEVIRTREPVLLPTPGVCRRIGQLAARTGAQAVVLDPALPLGMVGPHLELPYAVVLHGAEITVPGRLPGSRQLLARVVSRASLVIAAGRYPAAEARRAVGRSGPMPRVVCIPPGVDTERFRPRPPGELTAVRGRFGLPVTGPLVVSVSRLVPRKGMDTLIRAAARLAPSHAGLTVAVAGAGRDARRLGRLIEAQRAPVRLLGRVDDDELPALYASADVFAMCCRTRWGGLEQEGFGIVFLEAAACGVPSVAGQSGGAAEAVDDGVTGAVVGCPGDPEAVAAAIAGLLDDPLRRRRQGEAARCRAQAEFAYDGLASTLDQALAEIGAPR